MPNIDNGDLQIGGKLFINNDKEVPTKEDLKLWQPNMTVEVGDRVIIPGKPGIILECTEAGITGDSCPIIE